MPAGGAQGMPHWHPIETRPFPAFDLSGWQIVQSVTSSAIDKSAIPNQRITNQKSANQQISK
jgi:hypothetical protein